MTLGQPPVDPSVTHLTERKADDDGVAYVACVCGWKSPTITEEKFVEPIRWRHEKLGSHIPKPDDTKAGN